MCEGTKHNIGIVLCTDSFTLEEIQLLMKVLRDNFNLMCTRQESTNRIYISKESMSKLNSLVSQHMVPEMLYKLHI